jgi:RimJ/RimL family protein N-acetyltransferase
MNKATRLAGVYCQGLISDLDFFYILRIGGKDGSLIGSISLQQRNKAVPPDIGWCLLESFMGKGYATEGAQRIPRYLREDFGLHEVMAWPGLTNRESCRVVQKIGLVEGGLVRSKETGENDMVYILPGMHFDSNITISMWGDEGSTGHV